MRWVKYDKIEKIRKHLIIVFVNLFLQKFIFIALFLRFSVSILAFTHWQAYTLTHTHTISTSIYLYKQIAYICAHCSSYVHYDIYKYFFFYKWIVEHSTNIYTKRPLNIFTENKSEFLRQHTPMKWLNGYHKVSQINVSRRISLGGLKSLETRVLRSTVGGGRGQGGVAR